MKQYNRVCARINLDAIAYNMEQMKNRIGQEGRLIAVIKTDAYGHGAVPLAEMFEETPYIWGYAVACMGEARTLRAHGIKKPILILGCVFPDEYESRNVPWQSCQPTATAARRRCWRRSMPMWRTRPSSSTTLISRKKFLKRW